MVGGRPLEKTRGTPDGEPPGSLNIPAVPTTDPFGAAEDPAMPFLASALDPSVMEAKLEAVLPRRTTGSGEALASLVWGVGSGEKHGGEASASEAPSRNRRESVGRESEGIEGEGVESIPDSRLPTPDSPYSRLAEIRVVRHKPGKRCLVEYDVETPGGEGFLTVIGKVRARGMDGKSLAIQKALWDAGFDGGSRFAVARPLGEVPELHMWLQKKEPGAVATDALAGPDGEALAKRISELSHELHERGVVPRRPPHTMDDELRILHERLALVSEERPRWRGRIDRVLAACRRLGEALPEAEKVPIHRDFYADQILVDGDRLVLLDFDLYCEGDPGLDIGNFIAHMTEYSVRRFGSPDGLKDREDAMEGRFAELSGERVRGAVRVYAALTLARHIHVSRRIPERRGATESILELCEERLLVGSGRHVFGI